MIFFNTREYKNYETCHKRCGEKPTDNNMRVYLDWLTQAMEKARDEYNDLGWNKHTCRYNWHKKLF